MAFTSPKTWTSALVTVAEFNEQIRDNMLALKDPPTDLYDADEGADYTTTSTSFADIDATNLALTITTTGGDVLITFTGATINSGGNTLFDVHESVANARLGGDDGITRAPGSGVPLAIAYWVQGLAAGSHTFKLQWRVNAGTATLYAGAGTSNADIHPQFAVREVS